MTAARFQSFIIHRKIWGTTPSTKQFIVPMRWLLTVAALLLAVAVGNWAPLQLIAAVPYNWYFLHKHLPISVLNHYIEKPLSDMQLIIPVHFSNEFTLPDVVETLDIQVEARMLWEFFILPEFKFQLQLDGDRAKYIRGEYPNDELFVGSVLSGANGIQIDGARNYAELYYTLESMDSNDFPFFLTQLLVDHCFKGEIEKYTPDSFYKLKNASETDSDHFTLIHSDYKDQPFVRAIIDSAITGKPAIIKLNFYVFASDLLNLDMLFTAEKKMIPFFSEFEDFVQFEINVREYTSADPNTPGEMHTIDDRFPRELTDLPLLSQLYESTLENDDHNTIHFVLYPFPQGGERIKAKVVDGSDIYSEEENTFLHISDWGSIYFSHIPDNPKFDAPEIRLAFSVLQLEDCMWSFTESLLDGLGVPCERLAPAVRLRVWKRYLCVQNVIQFSLQLARIRKLLYGAKLLKPVVVRNAVHSVQKGLSIRSEVLKLLQEDRLEKALSLSITLVRTLKV